MALSLTLSRFGYKFDLTIPIILGLFATAWYGGRGPGILLGGLLVLATAMLATPAADVSLPTLIFGYATVFGLLVLIVWLIAGRRDARIRNQELRRLNELLLSSAGDGIVGVDRNGKCTFANPAAAAMVGRGVDEIIGASIHDLIHHSHSDGTKYIAEECPILSTSRDGELHHVVDEVFWRKDGTSFSVEYTSTPIRENGKLVGSVTIFRDVTKQRQIELAHQEQALLIEQSLTALRSSEERYRYLFESNPMPMWVYEVDTLLFLAVNKAAISHYGYSQEEFLRMNLKDIRPEEDVPKFLGHLSSFGGSTRTGETWRHKKKDGTVIDVEVTSHDLSFGGRRARLVLVNDITERRSLEEQLRQSQKMEAIGMLAGGIAHDFNNLLTAINGYSDLIVSKISRSDPIRPSIDQIVKAGKRAAALTAQLLAFSRKQVLQPKVIDLNTVVADLEKMLRRIIGEHIHLAVMLDPKLRRTSADPGQIEQVLLNLVVNARDAMPDGGTLTIETKNTFLDEEYCKLHVSAIPGYYVMIAVSDTGVGMNTVTQERIFEPFFSTKETGKGTGLGLSTTYGIVKQSGGHIWVYSEIGQGTTFKIYFPVAEKELSITETADESGEAGGGETLLLTEDEEMVRTLATDVLEAFGYKVLAAENGAEALEISQSYKGKIDLILTDVIMPGIGGRELVERITASRPELKVVYMSGYTDNTIVQNGMITTGHSFIQKPFSVNELVRKVREALTGDTAFSRDSDQHD